MADKAFLPPPVHPSSRSRSSPGLAAVHATARPPPRIPVGRSTPVSTPSRSPAPSETSIRTIGAEAELGSSAHTLPSSPKFEEELSEAQLRELYDDEEIERFLHLFSAYVREVRASDVVSMPTASRSTSELSINVEEPDGEGFDLDEDSADEKEAPPSCFRRRAETQAKPPESMSERIASNFIIPLLPPPPPSPPKFDLQRFKLTIQRLYLATAPVYLSFFSRLIRLATWEDRPTSLNYCIAYWILWYLNLLLPALVLRLLYSLIRRKMLPYPTLKELRRHRQEVDRAKEISKAVILQAAATPTYDVNDVFKLFTTYVRSRKAKKAAKGKDEVTSPSGIHGDSPISPTKDEPDAPPISPVVNETDVKTLLLDVMNKISDVHERLNNIFLWRRPNASLVCFGVLVALFFLALIPAKYLAKMTGFALGIAFWHVVPIVAAIPPADLARIPPPLRAIPTDAEYAMELISQRVARGLEVNPKSREPSLYSVDGAPSESSTSREDDTGVAPSPVFRSSVNWKKWGGHAAAAKDRTSDVKQMFTNGEWKRPSSWAVALSPLKPQAQVVANGRSEPRVETHTFPAQCAKATGLITLTSDMLIFTPLLSNTARLSIPMQDMLGVRKTSTMRGLSIRWVKVGDDGQAEEQETKFMWIGARNELFARLIGLGGRRWAKV